MMDGDGLWHCLWMAYGCLGWMVMASGIAYGWLMARWDGAGVGIRGGHWQAGHASSAHPFQRGAAIESAEM